MIRQQDSIELCYKVSNNTTRSIENDISISKSEILKIHLMTEVILDNIICVAFNENSEAITSLDLAFRKKLELCKKLKLKNGDLTLCPDVVNSLRKLNRLRNNIAIDVNKEITLDQVEGLFVGQLKEKRDGHSLNDPAKLILSLYKSMIYINMLNPERSN